MARAAAGGSRRTARAGRGAADRPVRARTRSEAVTPVGGGTTRGAGRYGRTATARTGRSTAGGPSRSVTGILLAASTRSSGARRSRATEPSQESTARPSTRSRSRRPRSRRRVTVSGGIGQPLASGSSPISTATRPRACGSPRRPARKAGTEPLPRSLLRSPHQTSSASRSSGTRARATSSLGAPAGIATRTSSAAPHAAARRSAGSAPASPAVTTRTRPPAASAQRSAHSSAASSAGEAASELGSGRTSPVSGSTAARSSTTFQQTATSGPVTRRSPSSRHPVGDAGAAFRVVPGDGALLVADEVARAALEALLVVEQDAPVRGGHEELGRAGRDALARRAPAAGVAVDRDVRDGGDPELGGRDLVLEGERRHGAPAHPKVRHAVHPSLIRSRTRSPALRSSRRATPVAPGFGLGLRTVNISSTTLHTKAG